MASRRWVGFAAAALVVIGAVIFGPGCNLVLGIHDLAETAGVGDGGMICNNAAQCDDQDQCTTETCDNGVCGHVPVANGPAADQTAGDCKTVQCDGQGVATDANDDQDIVPDMNPCTIDACKDGAPTHDDAPDMTACTQGALTGLCMGGMCMAACTTDAMCDDQNPCTTDACDGTTSLCVHTNLIGGSCKKPDGQSCAADGECVSGACADGYCCDTACTGTCQGCDLAGSLGACGNVPSGSPDANGSPACNGGSDACDGAGHCKEQSGQPCLLGSDCSSSFCVDGYCCNSACTGTCMQCNIGGSLGVCSATLAGLPDTNAAVACAAPNACDGVGDCKKSNGQACSASSECVSGACVDGYCCNNACTGTCMQCNLGGTLGTCLGAPLGVTDTNATVTCLGTKVCDGTGSGVGACKLANGQPCGPPADNTLCASGNCVANTCAP